MMPIGAFEIRTAHFISRVNVPTATSFIGDKGQFELVCDCFGKLRVGQNRVKTVWY
jgi:hypothetical protein